MKHVLVVDDNPTILTMISQILNDRYKVYVVTDATQAIAVLTKREIDLIILDMIMPVIDGNDALDEIKEINPNVKIVMLSALTNDRNEICSKFGVDDYLQKPLSAQVVNQIVDKVLGAN